METLKTLIIAGCILTISSVAKAGVIDSGNCGAKGSNITWTYEDDGVLSFTGEGDMADYDFIQDNTPWRDYKNETYIVTFTDGITSIGAGAFTNMHSLATFDIPQTVTSIGDGAFWGCGGVIEFEIPNSVKTIGAEAFTSCVEIKSITIPASVETIGGGAFQCCTNLKTIEVEAANEHFTSVDGVLYTKDMTTLKQHPGGKSGNYAVPEGVTSIDDGAFYYCKRVYTITLPESLLSIGDRAFSNTNITSATIPDGVTVIGSEAYSNCMLLSSVTLGNGLVEIGNKAFEKCYSLTSIVIPDAVESLGDKAFYYSSLKNIKIGNGVTTIGNDCFNYCMYLSEVEMGQKVECIGDEAFFGCSKLENIQLPRSLKEIGAIAFSGTALKKVVIPVSVEWIGRLAFETPTITDVFVEWPEPLECDIIMDYDTAWEVKLHIPDGTLIAYQNSEVWMIFQNLVEYECDGIRNTTTSQPHIIYDLSGRKLSTPNKGVNIINGKKWVMRF